jgi:hypothetical protein
MGNLGEEQEEIELEPVTVPERTPVEAPAQPEPVPV